MKTTKLIAIFILLVMITTACASGVKNQNNNEQLGASPTDSTTMPPVSTTIPTVKPHITTPTPTVSTTIPTVKPHITTPTPTVSTTMPQASSTTTTPVTSGTVISTTVSTTIPGKPLAAARIGGRAEYELMKLALTDDAALEEFVNTVANVGGLLKTRDVIADFMELLNKIPNFSIDNAKEFSIHYEPENDWMYVVYKMSEEAQAHWFRFEYVLDEERNAEWKERILKEVGTREFEYLGKENNIKLLQVVNMSGSKFAKTMAIYYVEVDGMVISVTYKNIYTDVPAQTPAEVFAPIRLEKTFDTAVTESFKSSSVK